MKPGSRPTGFTLIEMMVTLAVVTILALAVAPSFLNSIDGARLRSQVVAVVDVLQFAKSSALKQSNVQITISPGTSWSVQATAKDGAGTVIDSRTATADAINGCTLASPTATSTLTTNYRGVFSYSSNSNNIVLQSRQGKQVQISVNAIGGVSVCSVGGTLPGYSTC